MRFSTKANRLYVFLLAHIRSNNRVKVIPLKNKSFDCLYTALETLTQDPQFAHIRTILSDQESGFRSGISLQI